MDRDHAFAIPENVFRPLLEYLNTTNNEPGSHYPHYWHVQLTETPPGNVSLIVPKKNTNLDLSEYMLSLSSPN
jgi:hypothetical protein